jgi:hypothetical protein
LPPCHCRRFHGHFSASFHFRRTLRHFAAATFAFDAAAGRYDFLSPPFFFIAAISPAADVSFSFSPPHYAIASAYSADAIFTPHYHYLLDAFDFFDTLDTPFRYVSMPLAFLPRCFICRRR